MSEEYSLEMLSQLAATVEKELESVGSWANIGKFDYRIEFIHWQDGQKVPVDYPTYTSLPRKEKSGNFVITVDLMEFNSDAQKDFVRYLRFNEGAYIQKGEDGKKVAEYKPNFQDIFVKSAYEFTPDAENDFAAIEALKGKYVNIQEVQANLTWQIDKKEGYDKYPKIVTVFNDRDAAYAAYQALRAGGGDATDDGVKPVNDQPESWTPDYGDWNESKSFVINDLAGKEGPELMKAAKVWGLSLPDAIKLMGGK